MIERILIVGSGSAGQRHVRIAKEMFPDAAVVILSFTDSGRSLELNCTRVSSVQEAILFKPNIAVIANPAPFHLDISLTLASNFIHLLIEKPLSHDSAGIDKLIALCKENRIVIYVGYNLRFLNSLDEFRRLVRSNIIGNPWIVKSSVGQYLPDWRPNLDYRKSVSAHSALGGGALLELSHEIDYLTWIFGKIKWVEALLLKQGDLDIDVEDYAQINFGIKYGDHQKTLIASLSLDFLRMDPVRSCEVHGANGALRWDGILGTVEFYSKKDRFWKIVFKNLDSSNLKNSYLLEWKYFINQINSSEMSTVSGEDALHVVKVIEACRESSRFSSRRWLD